MHKKVSIVKSTSTSNPTPPVHPSSRLPPVRWVELVNQSLRIPKILRRIPASPYLTVTRPVDDIMELPVTSLRVKDQVDFPFIRVIDAHRLRVRWWLARDMGCIAVKQRDVENIVLRDHIQKV